MKKMLAVSLILTSLPLMAEDLNYKHCAGAFNSFSYNTNNFAEMDAKGEFKINQSASSMEVKGNKLVYHSLKNVDKKSLFSKKAKQVAVDKETFEIEYESIVDGKPVGKVKTVSYKMENLKDLDNKKPGAVDISFDFKNGQCVPQVTKLDVGAGLSPVLRSLYNGMNKRGIIPEAQRDLYKCKELYDYMKDIKDVEACKSTFSKLKRLEQLVSNVEAAPGKETPELKHKKLTKARDDYYEIITKATIASYTCEGSGYKEVLADDEFWKTINEKSVAVDTDTTKVQAK